MQCLGPLGCSVLSLFRLAFAYVSVSSPHSALDIITVLDTLIFNFTESLVLHQKSLSFPNSWFVALMRAEMSSVDCASVIIFPLGYVTDVAFLLGCPFNYLM